MSLEVAGVYDIEAANWTRFRVGQITTVDGRKFVSWDADEFWHELASRKGVYYAHAGGTYDALAFLDWVCRKGVSWSAMMRGSGVLSVKVGEMEARDSLGLIPMSLAKAAPIGGRAKETLNLPCECGADCGGYCALARPLTWREKRKVEAYLNEDCESLKSVLDTIEAYAYTNDIALRLTVGGTAWATAKKWGNLPNSLHSLGRYGQIREGYYGGRTEVYREKAKDGHRHDIHSSYPAALTKVRLPVGQEEFLTGTRAAYAYGDGLEGVVTADVFVPYMNVPPLPVREKERLLYPVGPISGTWTALELRAAEENGARVERVRAMYAWRRTEPLLSDYAKRVWALRARAEKQGNSALAEWDKFLANSLTGKLGQRPEKTEMAFVAAKDGPPELDEGTDIVNVTKSGVFIRKTRTRVDPCAHVQWCAYLTAYARVELGAQLRHSKEPYYCDTDSVYSRDKLTRRMGDELGEWGYEGDLREWSALAPKVYRYKCTGCKKHPNGDYHVRGKGMSGLDYDGFESLANGGTWSIDRGVQGLRTSARKDDGLFKRRALARGLHPVKGWIGGRLLHPDGSTSPPTVAAYRTRDVKGKRRVR